MSSKPKRSYPFNSFYEIIKHHSSTTGKKVALFSGDNKVTYKELHEKADCFSSYLHRHGVKRGDKVALFLRNSIEFIVSFVAISKLGAITVPINTFLKEDELAYILDDSDASMLIASAIYESIVRKACSKELIRNVIWEGDLQNSDSRNIHFCDTLKSTCKSEKADISIDDTVVVIYTSGTTGKPKGAMLSYRNIFSNCEGGIERVNVTSKDRGIVFLPMFHSFTLSIGVVLMLYVGASIVIIQSIQPFANIFQADSAKASDAISCYT